MRELAERRLWWLLLIVILLGINALVSGCSLVSSPNLAQQMQQATANPLQGNIVFSDVNVWQVIAANVSVWNNNKSLSELFLYGSEVSLAALTAAILIKPQAAQGLAVGQSIWMALLKIFRPAEFSLAYTQGMLLINQSTAEYTLCLSASGEVIVPRDRFTQCGAVLYARMVSAINLVMSLKAQLLPQAQDIVNVAPPYVKLPTTMTLPQAAVRTPTIP